MYQPYPGHETQLPPTERQVGSTQHALIAGFIARGVIAAAVFPWRRTSSAYFRPVSA